MRSLLFLIVTGLLLTSCASTDDGVKFINKSPRGITIINILKEDYSKAYQKAEKHCAKYSKVPRILKKKRQTESYDVEKLTLIMECIRPSR